jgi:hypothetical protein
MKRIITLLAVLALALASLSARPQFYFGTGAEWGRLYPSESMKADLGENGRYGDNVYYLSYIVPGAELTFIPYADFPLGITLKGGYGFVTARNNGNTSYSYNPSSYSDNYRYGSDDIISLSGGITYTFLADSDRYFSFTFSALYGWDRFNLDAVSTVKGTRKGEIEVMTSDVHSVSLDFGIMGRYDKSYFRIGCDIRKTLNPEKGITGFFDAEGYSVTIAATIGIVFTFLQSNQFMR